MGTVSRVHTFSSGAVLTAAQLNNEFDNLLTSSAINGGINASNLGVTAGQVTASKALVVDSSRDLDDTSASNQVNNLSISGTLKLADNKALSLGSNDDITIQYDETTNDALEIAAAVEGAALAVVLKADQGDDAGDEWKVGVADGGVLTFGNDIASAGTYVTGLTLTPNSTTASWLLDFEGDVDIGGDTLSFNGAATIDTSGNNALTIDAGSATLTLDGGTIESDATTLSFDGAISIDTSGNNAITLDSGSATMSLDAGTIESDATTLSFDAATSIDTSGNNNLTLSAGTATLVVTAGDVTVFDDNNNADTSLAIGTSATEALFVEALNGGSNKTLEELRFTTKTASGTADHGKVTWYIDEAEIATIDDGGIDLASGKTYTIAGSAISSGDFSGPGSSTDNAVVRFDGTGGKTGQNSGLIVDDSINVSGANSITMADGKEIVFGSNDDIKVEYDEAGADALLIQASVDDAPVAIVLSADASADAGDDWKINAANGGTLTFGNDIASAGTFVTGLTITPHATTASWSMDFEGDVDIGGDTLSFNGAATIDSSGNNAITIDAGSATLSLDAGTIASDASTLSFDGATSIDTSGNNNLTLSAGTASLVVTAGDVTIYDDNNNADTSLSIGTSATEALFIEALNGGSNKTLEELRFTTKTASGTGDHGKVTWYIDEAEIATIDDGGIDLASGKAFSVNGSAVGGAALTGSTATTVTTVTGADAIQGETDLRWASQILSVDGASSTWDSHIGMQAHMCFIGHEDSHATNCEWTSNAYYNGAWKYIGSGEAARIRLQTGTLNTYHAVSGSADASLSWVSNMYTGANGEWIWEATGSSAFVIATSTPKKPSGGDWSATSDSRLKTVTSNYTLGLDELCNANIRPVNYQYNGKGGTNADGKTYVGLVAQEVEQVFPNSVTQFSAKINDSDASETSDLRQFDGSEIKWALVNAVKELKAELDAAKARIATLEAA